MDQEMDSAAQRQKPTKEQQRPWIATQAQQMDSIPIARSRNLDDSVSLGLPRTKTRVSSRRYWPQVCFEFLW